MQKAAGATTDSGPAPEEAVAPVWDGAQGMSFIKLAEETATSSLCSFKIQWIKIEQ